MPVNKGMLSMMLMLLISPHDCILASPAAHEISRTGKTLSLSTEVELWHMSFEQLSDIARINPTHMFAPALLLGSRRWKVKLSFGSPLASGGIVSSIDKAEELVFHFTGKWLADVQYSGPKYRMYTKLQIGQISGKASAPFVEETEDANRYYPDNKEIVTVDADGTLVLADIFFGCPKPGDRFQPTYGLRYLDYSMPTFVLGRRLEPHIYEADLIETRYRNLYFIWRLFGQYTGFPATTIEKMEERDSRFRLRGHFLWFFGLGYAKNDWLGTEPSFGQGWEIDTGVELTSRIARTSLLTAAIGGRWFHHEMVVHNSEGEDYDAFKFYEDFYGPYIKAGFQF